MKKDYKDDIRAVDKPPVAEKRFSVKRLFFGTFMIMFIALACFVGGIVFINHARDTEPKAVMTSTQLSSQLEDIGELATVKYLYTNMGKFEESTILPGQLRKATNSRASKSLSPQKDLSLHMTVS